MPYNGSGSHQPPSASFPAVPGTLISSSAYNATILDLSASLTGAMTKDGQSVVTGNIPMNGFKVTGVAPGTLRGDVATIANLQDGTGVTLPTVGGTGDAITLTPSPAITAYASGQTFSFVVALVNTTAVTVAVSGLTAKAITKNGTVALAAGDLVVGSLATITYDGTRFLLRGQVASGFVTFTGPTGNRSYALPDFSTTILTTQSAVTVAQGGTGVATLAANGVLYGNGTGVVLVTAQPGTNTILHGSAGAPAFTASPIIQTSVQLGVVSSSTGALKLGHASSANLTTIQAGNASAAVTYTLPTAAPTVSGQALTSTTAGVTSWATAGRSFVSIVAPGVGQWAPANGNYYAPGGPNITGSTVFKDNCLVVPYTCTAKNMTIHTAVTGTDNVQMVLYVNGAGTSLTVNALTQDSVTQDTSNTVAITAGDRISFVCTGGTGNCLIQSMSVELAG